MKLIVAATVGLLGVIPAQADTVAALTPLFEIDQMTGQVYIDTDELDRVTHSPPCLKDHNECIVAFVLDAVMRNNWKPMRRRR